MTISREKLHDLIDQIPDDRLSYLDDVLDWILRSELHAVQRVKTDMSTPAQERKTAATLDDIFRDQDV
ncbi:hypothetical protein DesLBE_2490 [Desulfitobacterium sp. LBE]|uniref:Uncharacterized protein n=4 Tax=root TaxID=1 RepID=A0A0W1JM45_DESHA|nr:MULTISPECIES: hypothetical protein [Desulfitobacterium]ACL18968.1 hypothetical protein Dhaf_0905 [Desulfitobacterium hafniense DCB-2]EHL09184.1 hypothetical protein HMPREF0322_00066 [Desulfitobacterium hafniense DP7]KTE92809.1 hypothetical protein AT727_17985 [Desulfitobacterium hafniense]MEA5025068.1 hypothetical protein [Desulfitobacterium hafniense]TWH58182.1 hypothetical protein DesLBE_2490 [Desulfitobacterium sp. LBE]